MRVLIQRVQHASVTVDQKICGSIHQGLMVLAGFAPEDTEKEMDKIIQKILQLRIFNDAEGKMNLSVQDISGELLIISQFTLYADSRKGNRPSYIQASPPEKAKVQYARFMEKIRLHTPLKIESGIFAADMKVDLLNDGPVTIWLDTDTL